MLTRTIAILLLLCSVSLSLSGLMVFAGFEMNRGYIAKELCENINKPQLHCNGKCYLMRKLKQAQDKEQKQEQSFQKVQLQEALCVLPFSFKQYPLLVFRMLVPQCTGKPVARVRNIFQPPRLFLAFNSSAAV